MNYPPAAGFAHTDHLRPDLDQGVHQSPRRSPRPRVYDEASRLIYDNDVLVFKKHLKRWNFLGSDRAVVGRVFKDFYSVPRPQKSRRSYRLPIGQHAARTNEPGQRRAALGSGKAIGKYLVGTVGICILRDQQRSGDLHRWAKHLNRPGFSEDRTSWKVFLNTLGDYLTVATFESGNEEIRDERRLIVQESTGVDENLVLLDQGDHRRVCRTQSLLEPSGGKLNWVDRYSGP